jgi:periplasmic protein TonB
MSQRDERSRQPDLPHWLIGRAASRAPQSLSCRLEEEWLADLESRTSALSRLRFAIGCCWATLVIASDYSRSQVAVASTTAAARGFVALVDRNFSYFSLRSATLFLIAGLHAAIFYGLITTLSHTHAFATPSDLQNSVVKQDSPKTAPLPTPPGMSATDWTIDLKRLVVDIPRTIDIETDVTTNIDNTSDTYSPPLPPEPPAHVAREVAGGPGAGFPDTADFYPSMAIRAGEEGITAVRVCVNPNGRLTSEPTIVKTSGSARLDAGALKLAQAGSGHYRATTEDGQAVNSCYPFGVRFQLKK